MNLMMLSGDSSVAQGRDGAFYQMLRRFSAHWTRIDILCPRAPEAEARQIHDNVFVHPSPYSKILQPRFIVQQGRALFRDRRYDLVTSHDFGFFYNGVGAWWLTRGTGVPYVSEILHVEGYPRAATWRDRLYNRVARIYIRWVRHRAAAIRVMNSVEMPGFLRRLGVPDDRILVLPALYIDYDVFQPRPDPVPRYDVLFVGRLAANKGLRTLIDALAQVRATHPDVRLGIRGKGPLRTELDMRIAALDLKRNVTFIPRLGGPHDLAALYNQARMLVCASTAEGGPRVTIEAMACGVPVISTPVGIMAELMRPGTNMLIFHWDAAELAEKICVLLDNEPLRRQLGENGRAAVQHFDADRIIAQYAAGYHALIERLTEPED